MMCGMTAAEIVAHSAPPRYLGYRTRESDTGSLRTQARACGAWVQPYVRRACWVCSAPTFGVDDRVAFNSATEVVGHFWMRKDQEQLDLKPAYDGFFHDFRLDCAF